MNSYENEQLSYECDLTAERDHLREVNRELVRALEAIVERADEPCSSIARVALERAKSAT